jgi:hypothetical protein
MGLITLRKSGLVAAGGCIELHHRPNAPVVLDFFQQKNRKVIGRPGRLIGLALWTRIVIHHCIVRLGDICDTVPLQSMRF